MTRSLIDALNRTEAINLAKSILDDITLEALNTNSVSGWQWFVHFALMGLQLKFEVGALHQVLVDLDGILQLIDKRALDCCDSSSILSTKVLFICFLNLVLASDRKIMSVFMTLPKAAVELRQALNELPINEATLGSAVLGEMVLLIDSLTFGTQLSTCARLEQVLAQETTSPVLTLPGHLQFVSREEAQLIVAVLKLFESRSLGGSFESTMQNINSICSQIQTADSCNSALLDNMEMTVSAFKMTVEMEHGTLFQSVDISKPAADPNFAKKFKDFLLLFMGHAIVGRLGIPKVDSFYDRRMKSTKEVDLECLLHLNRLFMHRSTEQYTEALSSAVHNLAIPRLQLFFLILRVTELKRLGAPAHHIRDALFAADGIARNATSVEPILFCWLNLLQGEYHEPIDFNTAIAFYQAAYSVAKEQLSHPRLTKLAGGKLFKLHKMIGEDQQAQLYQ